MEKILYGTKNPGKLEYMRTVLDGMGIEIIGLNDMDDIYVKPIDESGSNPLENAKIKALAYYDAFKIPVFSCDSGLYIDGLDKKSQPGVHVRRVKGRELNDEEMIEYYSNLAAKFGGLIKARYKNAICLVLDENNIFEYDGEDISFSFLITSKPHPKRRPGFPLDSISINIDTGKYYFDMDTEDKKFHEIKVAQGFRNFFLRTLNLK